MTALAGCSGSGDDREEAPEDVQDYLASANNFDGEIVDMTGQDEVTVDVGAGSNGYGFDPAAVKVSTGTTVVWDWTGRGSRHSIYHDPQDDSEKAFDSGDPVRGEDQQFEHTFEEAGTYPYTCWEDGALGMDGAVVVEESEDEGE